MWVVALPTAVFARPGVVYEDSRLSFGVLMRLVLRVPTPGRIPGGYVESAARSLLWLASVSVRCCTRSNSYRVVGPAGMQRGCNARSVVFWES